MDGSKVRTQHLVVMQQGNRRQAELALASFNLSRLFGNMHVNFDSIRARVLSTFRRRYLVSTHTPCRPEQGQPF